MADVDDRSEGYVSQRVVEEGQPTIDQLGNQMVPTRPAGSITMVCSKCGSNHVVVSASATEKGKARHSVAYWLLVGWWLHPILWVAFTLPMLIWRLINPNKKTKTVITTTAVCQSCGNTWVIKQ